jgi:hypothetical protein
MALLIGQSMSPPIGPQHIRLGQRPRIAPIRLHLSTACAYIGAKLGPATMTSCPSASQHRATHSLSVAGSIRIRARGRWPGISANRPGSVRTRR